MLLRVFWGEAGACFVSRVFPFLSRVFNKIRVNYQVVSSLWLSTLRPFKECSSFKNSCFY